MLSDQGRNDCNRIRRAVLRTLEQLRLRIGPSSLFNRALENAAQSIIVEERGTSLARGEQVDGGPGLAAATLEVEQSRAWPASASGHALKRISGPCW